MRWISPIRGPSTRCPTVTCSSSRDVQRRGRRRHGTRATPAAASARELASPRTVHTLPDGDVLLVQGRAPEGKPKSRPKDIIRDWIMAIAHGSGGPKKGSHPLTLLRGRHRGGEGG